MSETKYISADLTSSPKQTTGRIVAAFDFDGTITNRDTFTAFIRFVKGEWGFWKGIFANFPYLLAFALKLYPNAKAKQKLFSYYFRGMDYPEFRKYGRDFAASCHGNLIRPDAWKTLKAHLSHGDQVYIVSASLTEWVEPFFREIETVTVLATKPEVDPGGKLTGFFRSANCYGPEKVRRLFEKEPVRDSYVLYAYGDSKGDKELIESADYGKYNCF